MIWAQIAASVLGFLGGCLLIVRGFHGAGDALECVLDGRRRDWWRVGAWLLLGTFGGAGLSAGIVTYWLSVTTGH